MCFHTIYSSCDLKAQLNALKYSYAELIQGSCGPKEKYVWTSTSEEGPCGAECVVEKLIPKMLHPSMRLEAVRTQPHIQMHHILYYLLQAIAGLAERKPPHLTNQVLHLLFSAAPHIWIEHLQPCHRDHLHYCWRCCCSKI